ncbi:unnamed protein product [Cyprideis torosa]|uniref:Uncharacterized protein n=1 Tax=Cyprideis torosa TaxID=163714 RepID=A0A7R8ZUU0_9CRUS|nr:unnamed protein product [Cyprideis torosa]CAG0909416.1 unnamed protein product [Cyprideis torosa]
MGLRRGVVSHRPLLSNEDRGSGCGMDRNRGFEARPCVELDPDGEGSVLDLVQVPHWGMACFTQGGLRFSQGGLGFP